MSFFTNYKTKTDEQLMLLYQEGDSAAFNTLYHRYSKRLLHFAFRILNQDQALAEDVLHDVFLIIAERPHLFNTEKTFKPWVFTVTANACKKQFRQPDFLEAEEHHFDADESHISVLSSLDQPRFKLALKQELQLLKYEHRCTFILRYQERLSIKEIASIMDCNEGTVKSRIHYTIKRLSTQLAIYNPNKTLS
ncbi:MAG: RNA polymerase sigma factor [Salibacteraceae bacterium]|nr:RNA polymerase sigma factor [Salibacteraceae bacterium]